MRPDFIVIGAMKCATSTICAYLEDHPDIFMVPRCEPSFFSHDSNFAKGPEWYEAHFDGRKREALCGEGSNSYAAGEMYPETVARMYHPGLKLIYMVRHPLDRIVSAWIQNRADSGDDVPATLDRAVAERPDIFVNQSLYWKNISCYRDVFPDAQIFIGFMEDLNSDALAFFADLTTFLGVVPTPSTYRGYVNPSAGKTVPSTLYTAVNQMPFSDMIKQLAPTSLKSFVKHRMLSRNVCNRPQFSPRTRAHVIDAVRGDAEKFLMHYGRPRDFWSFE